MVELQWYSIDWRSFIQKVLFIPVVGLKCEIDLYINRKLGVANKQRGGLLWSISLLVDHSSKS